VCVCVCVIGGFRAWVSVRGQNTQFVQYKNQYVYESPPHKDSKPDVCVCVCVFAKENSSSKKTVKEVIL